MNAMDAAAKVDRREALLEAAIRVIAQSGLRGLTHRAVEAEAGLPQGSTTYYFGTRHELMLGVMEHAATRGRAAIEPIAKALTLQLADRSQPLDIDAIATGLIAFIDAQGTMELARYELQIAGARDPQTKPLMTEICDIFTEMCVPIVIACGSKDPAGDAKIVQAAVDGWMFNRLTNANPSDQTIERGIRILLAAISDD